jgi:[CysO sulfur-carrier protein]-S-L-cysteine hydrolase
LPEEKLLPDSLIRITDEVRAALENQALESSPYECCGLLAGVGNLISAAYPLRNEADKPESRYFASPEDIFAAMRRMRDAGQEMLGIYHSHPRTPAYPSPTDVEMAFYPEANYFIIALEPRLQLRAFKINNANIEEINIRVVKEASKEQD